MVPIAIGLHTVPLFFFYKARHQQPTNKQVGAIGDLALQMPDS